MFNLITLDLQIVSKLNKYINNIKKFYIIFNIFIFKNVSSKLIFITHLAHDSLKFLLLFMQFYVPDVCLKSRKLLKKGKTIVPLMGFVYQAIFALRHVL